MPFRARPDQHLGPLSTDAAVHDAVGQMVRQFADELAFLRELVQNSLDADATAVEVLFDHHTVDGAAVLEISVRDDGRGMDQAAMERSLLVLFRSTKEGDASRIGKFGVGFFSVFAAAPDLVTVESGTDPKAPAVRLKLRPDFTWEMEPAAPRRGTSVRVRIPLRDKDIRALTERCVERLGRWCPHVRAPLTARFENIPGRSEPVRVDGPHRVEGVAVVSETHRDGVTVLGLSEAPSRSYYNRGLLLEAEHGARDDDERGLAWLIDAPDLHHTISRDAVVRDAAFARRLARVRALRDGPLRDKVLRLWNDAVERCAAARAEGRVDRESGALLASLARVLPQSPLGLGARALRAPLLEPVVEDGAQRRTRLLASGFFRAKQLYSARARSPLSAAVAATGAVLVDLAPCGDTKDDDAFAAFIATLAPKVVPCERAWALLQRVEPRAVHPAASALLDALVPLVTRARLGAVSLCAAQGSGADRLWYMLPGGHPAVRGAGVVSITEDHPFAFRRGDVLTLRAEHPDVGIALECARRDPRFAALALLRLVLLSAAQLDADTDELLLRQHAEAAR